MLGENIRKYRKANNISQEKLAEKLNTSRQRISQWEHNQTQPLLENIIAMAKIFDISTDALLCDETQNIENNEIQKDNKKIAKRKYKMIVAISIIFIVIFTFVMICLSLKDDIMNYFNEMSSEEIYELASPVTVEIQVTTDDGTSTGTGFFDDSDGTIITNYHVIEGGYEGIVKIKNGGKFDIESILGFDEELDIAIIKIEYQSEYVLNKRTTELTTGEKVYTIGSSEGLTDSFSSGIISAVNRDIAGKSFIQTTAPISHGNSGGPLIDRFGNVIGITSAGIEEGQNLNLAISVSEIENIARDKDYDMTRFHNLTDPDRPDYSEINVFLGILSGEDQGTVHLYTCNKVIGEYDRMSGATSNRCVSFTTLKKALENGFHVCENCNCVSRYWKTEYEIYN